MVVLAVTDEAIGAIRQLTHRHGESTRSGIRIANDEDRCSLTASIADGPQVGDRLVYGVGVPVYVDPVALSVLDGRTLDATVDESGAIVFSITGVSDDDPGD